MTESQSRTTPTQEEPIRIGRAPDNDLVLDDARVSRKHAAIHWGKDGPVLEDLGSHNGTFLNGRRITTASVQAGDVIGIGGKSIRFDGARVTLLVERHTSWFGAVDLTVTIDGHRILDEVSFALEPSSVLGVVGPSGSGKSTLLNALTGFHPADAGHVVFDGRDVYATYDHLRLQMGLVPQTDILHTQLTVRQALEYAAELRFSIDVGADARRRRVDEVIRELNLDDRAEVRIDRLSGGQRKRVSVACELLTEPALLFLDEPTSGLDPGNEAVLMALLRDLARAGRTVVVVTHSVQSLDLCDRVVVLAAGGRLAYFGPPAGAIEYFAQDAPISGYAEIFRLLEEEQGIDWKARFRADASYERYVSLPLGTPDLDAIPARPNVDAPPPPTPVLHQLGVLIRRYVAVIRADRGLAMTLVLQAPIFGVLFALMFRTNVMTTTEALNASVLIWLTVVGATWLGTSNAIREIVKELPIYRRERSIGLSAGAYVASKVVVLGLITAVQSAVLVPLALWNQVLPATDTLRLDYAAVTTDIPAAGVLFPGSGMVVELVIVAILVGVSAMALGLLVSSVAGGVDRAASLLPVILVLQVIVSAPLFNVPGLVLRGLGYLTSAQWGMAAAASTLGLTDVRRPYLVITQSAREGTVVSNLARFENPTWSHTTGAWFGDATVLVALAVLCIVGALLALRATDPDLMEGRHRHDRRSPVAWLRGLHPMRTGRGVQHREGTPPS